MPFNIHSIEIFDVIIIGSGLGGLETGALLSKKGYLYHIYNQGNNRRKIFFLRENYLFFLKKMHTYVVPYADILAWCLMPNHFHLMVLVKEVELPVRGGKSRQGQGQGFTMSEALTLTALPAIRTFNDSIGIMLRSYTRAINKQKGASGSLFRQASKAQCLNCPNRITPAFYTINGISVFSDYGSESDYPQVCFNYIHRNPVKAKMVRQAYDYEFSSAADYAGLREGKLINKNIATKYVDTHI